MNKSMQVQKISQYVNLILPILALLSLNVAVSIGPNGWDMAQVPAMIIWQLRLPRALSAFAVGGLLALAGVLMQVLLANPLADPYILGLSGGASIAAITAMLFQMSTTSIATAAFLGATTATFLLLALAKITDTTKLLLTGAVLAAGFGAWVSLLLTTATVTRLPGMLFWLMGDLSNAEVPLPPLLLLFFSTILAWSLANSINLLTFGEIQARAFGVSTVSLRLILLLLSALCTAVAVTVAGSIGFLGLIVPHLLRLLCITDHRLLIPNAAWLGAALLVIADTVARTAIAPRELPVGAITAILGVPMFLLMLKTNTLR